jgi:hypothetical protein
LQYKARCPKCDYEGVWKDYDRPSGEHNGFRIKRWNPHDIELLWDPWTEDVRYIWKIPEEYRGRCARARTRSSWSRCRGR